MKVLQIIDSLWVGGAQKLLVVFAQEMLRLGHQVEVITLVEERGDSPIYGDLDQLGIRVNSFPLKNLGDLATIWKLTSYIKKINPDIVHNQLNYANIIGTFAAYLSHKPSVASLHNASIFLFKESCYRTWLETWMLDNLSQRVIACSYTVADVHQLRFRKKRLVVISNPSPPLEHIDDKTANEFRKTWLNSEEGILLVSVGRLTPEKAYPDMFQAIRLISQKTNQKFKLLIAGSGDLFNSLQKMVGDLGLGDLVFFLGQRNDIPTILTASDIFISTSHFEGQSIAVLEAMSAGLPVIATDVGDNTRVIPKDCGIVLQIGHPEKVAERVLWLMNNPEERAMFARNTKQVSEKFLSPVKWVDKLLALYNEVLSE